MMDKDTKNNEERKAHDHSIVDARPLTLTGYLEDWDTGQMLRDGTFWDNLHRLPPITDEAMNGMSEIMRQAQQIKCKKSVSA